MRISPATGATGTQDQSSLLPPRRERSVMKITPSCGSEMNTTRPRSVPIAIGISRALVIAARRTRLEMHEQLGRLHHPCGFAIAQAIKDAGISPLDELAEHEAG